MIFNDFIKKIRKKKRVPQQYDIEKFKREKLIISFDNAEECEDFVNCCIAAGMYGVTIDPRFDYTCHFAADYSNQNRLVIINTFSFARLFIDCYGYKLARSSAVLIKKDNINLPSKADLMHFLGE